MFRKRFRVQDSRRFLLFRGSLQWISARLGAIFHPAKVNFLFNSLQTGVCFCAHGSQDISG